MRKLTLDREAAGFVDGLDAKRFKQVVSKLFSLLRDPMPNDSRTLQGFDGYRVDIGEFRIVYHFDEEEVTVDVIGKRNDDEVYRKLRRR